MTNTKGELFKVYRSAQGGRITQEWDAEFVSLSDLQRSGRNWAKQYGGCSVSIVRVSDLKTWQYRGCH